MAQTFPDIPSTDQLVNSRQKIVDRTDALRSQFSGTAFPASAVVGQIVVRTDEGKAYICTNATGPVFQEYTSWLLANVSGVVTYAKIQDVSAQNRLLARFSTGAGDVEEATLGTGLSFSGGALTVNVATAQGFTSANVANLSTDGSMAANSNTLWPSQAAVRTYVDNLVNGLKWKGEVRVATTGAGTLASSFENGDTVDGVVLATGDRILIKNQASGSENGIYVVAASGAPTRAADADASSEMLQAACFVREGTTNADTLWVCTNNSISLGSTALTFGQIGAGGSGITQLTGDVTAGPGSGSQAATIPAGTVTYAKMQDVSATSRVLGRITAGAGDVEELTAANLKTILSLAQADISGLTTASSPQFTGIELGHASDTTLSRLAAGVMGIEGKAAVRVNSGSAANSGLVTWGTAAPGTLAEGEIYLRHA